MVRKVIKKLNIEFVNGKLFWLPGMWGEIFVKDQVFVTQEMHLADSLVFHFY